MCENAKNGKEKKGDEDMAKTTLDHPGVRKAKVINALNEVDKIKSGKLPKKSARDFLKESRKR